MRVVCPKVSNFAVGAFQRHEQTEAHRSAEVQCRGQGLVDRFRRQVVASVAIDLTRPLYT
eukprot:1762975-Lingulodinium_polyedra.AAC.1